MPHLSPATNQIAGIVRWPNKAIEIADVKTDKFLTMHGSSQFKSNIQR